ncbi:carbohydrate ABC transporter permease [Streptomyces sp. TRM49041]|uniref:carbohydrate ABC transporter permease n=1 Tax=Streptomyces sp. TRM49041 TaxID=2603216 RepID=UPI0021CC70E3|nr:sugar ABC transporter permease [Streptomyces sp. TRM49041]
MRSAATKRENRDRVHGLLMAAPALAGLIAFVGVPFIHAVVLSFYNVRLGSPLEPSFFGLEHYRRLFTDPDLSGPFLRALLNNLTFAAVVVPLQTGLALALAILLNRKLKAIGLFRSLFFMPVVFPMALVAVIWRLILARSDQGMINSVLSHLTFGNWGAFDWLGDSATALASIIVLSIWQGVGFQMVILLAGLQHRRRPRQAPGRARGAQGRRCPRRLPRPGPPRSIRSSRIREAARARRCAPHRLGRSAVCGRPGTRSPRASIFLCDPGPAGHLPV